MSGNDQAGSRRPKADQRQEKGKTRKRASAPTELGRALRSVYDDTLREDVPNDFMDLLGKLS